METKQYFRPITNLATHPGELLAEEIEVIGMTQQELAKRMGRPPQVINEIIKGKKSITYDTAMELEKSLGISAQIWTNAQSTYDFTVARLKEHERWTAQANAGWLKEFPVKEIENRGWISRYKKKADTVGALLEFLGFASFDAWDKHSMAPVSGFRISENSKVSRGALAAWLRKGENEGRRIDTAHYEENKFQAAVTQIRTMTSDDPGDFIPQMTSLCAEAGVAVVFIPELPKSGANGVARWLTLQKGLIQMSLKRNWSDIFWFSFFHECYHILQHKDTFIHIDGINNDSMEENEADSFAANLLIPSSEWHRFMEESRYDEKSVTEFASQMGIDTGIVVGRMQREKLIPYSRLTYLKTRYQWAE